MYSGVALFSFQSVSPGVVETEFVAATGRDLDPKQVYSSIPHLGPKDVADAVLYVLGVPPHVQVRTGLLFQRFWVH
jgi:NADP-dependent 3-hydroxy acid dehydrogenase YdfG